MNNDWTPTGDRPDGAGFEAASTGFGAGMVDETIAAGSSGGGAGGGSSTTKKTAKKKTTKKTAKKAAAKKTAKKAATTKAATKTAAAAATAAEKTAEKTTKKTAKKAPAKKASAKKTARKTTKKVAVVGAEAEAESAPEPDSGPEDTGTADVGAGAPEAGEGEPRPKTKRGRRSRKGKGAGEDRDAGGESGPEDRRDAKPEGRPKPEARSRPEAGPKPQAKRDEPRPTPAKSVYAEMLIDYTPGEECRIAIVEDGQLEEFYSEPTTAVSRVGNIYRGKVTNVESQIQAAFVDFGLEEAGFLHVSDLHPKYFPGAEDDETERVGKKTPRRQRPPIQQCLKRGQEITVQVLKEGVGTKGPTLTSYLSIPGRYLVAMPDMDRVGVSRKVEDEDTRRQMRKILDQLDLPDGFGFILRTAGFDKTKEELDRDLAYLQRLWKDMERRRKGGRGPRMLYSESDLLVRTIRDQLTGDINRVVINNEHALRRAHAFMRIVTPRGGAKLSLYEGQSPIFHAFGVEQQIALMHAREVPLPSGGRLVIDQTEALVAIDVNSGKSRAARDAETNAYQTNIEACDEICRQLRLRDQGGLVICDLIDMRHASHRKSIEQRFHDRLKRDRARSTTLAISEFGILEMTRQRMRGSYEQQHFRTCPACSGRGLMQRPDSVAAEALRELAHLLDHEKIAKVELVVSGQVAGALLSTKRMSLGRIERASGKKVEVRISETMGASRFAVYAYDASGSDIDIERLPKKKAQPKVVDWEETSLTDADPDAGDARPEGAEPDWAADMGREAEQHAETLRAEATAHDEEHSAKLAGLPVPGLEAEEEDDERSGGKKKRRRRRRRGKRDEGAESGEERPSRGHEPASHDDDEDESEEESPATGDGGASDSGGEGEGGEGGRKKRRRRRRRRRGGEGGEGGGERAPANAEGADDDDEDDAEAEAETDEAVESIETDTGADARDDEDQGEGGRKKRRRRRRRRRGGGDEPREGEAPRAQPEPSPEPEGAEDEDEDEDEDSESGVNEVITTEVKPKRRRALYGRGRRTLTPSERARAGEE